MASKEDGPQAELSGFGDVFDTLLDASDGKKLTIDDVLDAFGRRAFGPLILVPSLLAILPTGAIPGVPITLGFVIILICSQLLIGKSSPWIPRRVRELSVDRNAIKKGWERFRPFFQRVDRIIGPRLTFLTDAPAIYVVAVLCIVLAALMAPLEIIPFAVAVPASGVAAFGLGIATRDGVVVLLGLLFCGLTGWLVAGIL